MPPLSENALVPMALRPAVSRGLPFSATGRTYLRRAGARLRLSPHGFASHRFRWFAKMRPSCHPAAPGACSGGRNLPGRDRLSHTAPSSQRAHARPHCSRITIPYLVEGRKWFFPGQAEKTARERVPRRFFQPFCRSADHCPGHAGPYAAISLMFTWFPVKSQVFSPPQCGQTRPWATVGYSRPQLPQWVTAG